MNPAGCRGVLPQPVSGPAGSREPPAAAAAQRRTGPAWRSLSAQPVQSAAKHAPVGALLSLFLRLCVRLSTELGQHVGLHLGPGRSEVVLN